MFYYKTVGGEGITTSVMAVSAKIEGDSRHIPISELEFNMFTVASPPHPTDYKAIYAAAKTDSERIAIIAQKLGLA